MANETILFKVVTPEGLSLEENVSFVKLPGKTGDIGILFNHSSILADLKAGKIRVKDENNQEKKFFIPKGIAHLVNNKLYLYGTELKKISQSIKHSVIFFESFISII